MTWKIPTFRWQIPKKSWRSSKIILRTQINSDSECLTKVTTKRRSQYSYSFLLRIKISKSTCEAQWQELFAEDVLMKLFSVQKYEDLIMIDHKVVQEENESRNNSQFAVVFQDLFTQWIQSNLSWTKTVCETERMFFFPKFLESTRESKVRYTHNSLLEEHWKIYHHTSTRHRSDTNDIAERDSRSNSKKDSSVVLLQSGLKEDGLILTEYICYLWNSLEFWLIGKLRMKYDLLNLTKSQ